MDANYLIILALSFLGSFIGVNFGGSMLMVIPALLGLGYNPITILCSTRPAIVMQSLIGLCLFRKYRDINFVHHLYLFLSASIGALIGIYFVASLTTEIATLIMLSFVIGLSIIAALKYFLMDYFKKDRGFLSSNQNSLISIITTGFTPAIIGGIIGSGAGLVVVLFALLLLNRGIKAASYLEKNVSLSHSSTVLLWSLFYGEFDILIGIIVFIGTSLGAYFGGKLTVKLNIWWMYGMIILLCLIIIIKKLIF